MRNAIFAVLVAAIVCGEPAWGAPQGPVTFYKDVLPILQENCQACHRAQGKNVMGMVAPMAFTSYEDTRPWAKAIAKQVDARLMPPWHASPEFDGHFKNERKLEQAEIDTLVAWAKSGAKQGNPADAPEAPKPKAASKWSIGEPDLVVPFDEPFFVPDGAEDLYQTVVNTISEEEMPEDRWIQAMEFRPGSEAVHHIVIFTDDYRESLGFSNGMLGGMGPGTDPTVFPEGYGRLLKKGTTIMFNMHYHKESGPGTGVWDHSEIGFKFHTKPVRHQVLWGAVGTQAISIPPNAESHLIVAQETFDKDTTILAYFPHTHLRGKASKYEAFYPDGTSEVLLHVPNYDFNWQTNYVLKEPKKIPAGTKIKVSMWYENTEARAEYTNINPNRYVSWGPATTDEMMYGWIDYCDTQPIETGDSD